ncbi:hypothetical protein JPSP8_12740 [Staphylococcus pseudintermedius]
MVTIIIHLDISICLSIIVYFLVRYHHKKTKKQPPLPQLTRVP